MRRILTPPGFKQYGTDITEDYNEIRPWDSKDARKAKLEAWIAKAVGKSLTRHYPNREWKVIVDIPGGMLVVACDSISNYKGYHIRLEGRNIQDLQERAKFAAGEILERHNVARSRRFDADILETLNRNSKDEVITSDSAAEPV